ncbi:Scr1 family TA system antitoxin-like transcriptional regulator [Amycolatopsis sp. PS_44_ISF1]|uniref:Scr1 family TA system antitoxin-like transcriptional regulator n=1 Tax=Amycolatopsis sp. PS_44_ISF1 TaxID=2974917 RepID=UPI0028DF7101|nr:Scr1 family TA system antitoxin-like transcriptional regulator [Amycolatopsis sp. PS_44_ISF1]MDT8910127.1 Scr1 family TA system antitoxin-like transcriptional regulator [Amycolatopsis sp. PS_44_ISF1]
MTTPDPRTETDEALWNDLGRDLRAARDAAGCDQHEAAQALGKHQTTVSKLENGMTSISREELIVLLDLYAAAPEAREAMLRNWDLIKSPTRQRGDDRVVTPQWFQLVEKREAQATAIHAWSGENFHGLIQSESFMILVFDGARRGTVMGDRMLKRLKRQRQFDRIDKQFVFLISTASLRNVDALPADIAADQLEHLIELAQRDNITIRLIPPPPNGYSEHNFVIMRFSSGERERAYSEYLDGVSWAAQRRLRKYRTAWAALQSIAFSAEDTLAELHRRYDLIDGRNPDRGT